MFIMANRVVPQRNNSPLSLLGSGDKGLFLYRNAPLLVHIPRESAEMTVGFHMVYKMVWKKGGSTNEILRKTQ